MIFHGPRGGALKPDTVRRILIRDVLTPLAKRFPKPTDEPLGVIDGLHEHMQTLFLFGLRSQRHRTGRHELAGPFQFENVATLLPPSQH